MSLRPKVAHLTSVHPAGDVRIFHKECRTLAAAGYEVVLVVPQDKDHLSSSGVRIHAVSRSRNRLRRMCVTPFQIYRTAVKLNADVYHFHDPELLPVGLLLKLHGKTVIYDAHENLRRDILTKEWVNPRIRTAVAKMSGGLEQLGVGRFDAVVTATPSIAQQFPKSKAVVVQNFPLTEELSAPGDALEYTERPFVAAYVGLLTRVRGAMEMVRAIHHVNSCRPASLVFAGDVYPSELNPELQREPGWNHVNFLGYRSRSEVRSLLGQARVGLVLFHPCPNYDDSQPNKLFEYLAAGIPIIASNFAGWKQLIEEVGCGVVVDPLRPEQIADAIRWMFDNPDQAKEMGQRGRDAVVTRYNWDSQAKTLIALYDRLTLRNKTQQLEPAGSGPYSAMETRGEI